MVSWPEYERFAAGSIPDIPADGAAARATKVVFPSSRPAPLIVPVVQSPIRVEETQGAVGFPWLLSTVSGFVRV